MREKLRFRQISRLRISETEKYQEKIQKDLSKSVENEKRKQRIELSLYDVEFERILLPTKFEMLNTGVKEIALKQAKEIALKQSTSPSFDIFLTQHTIKCAQTPTTDLIESRATTHTTKETIKIADIKLSATKVEHLQPLLNTDVVKGIQIDKNKTEGFSSSVDLDLESKTLLVQNSDLDTDVVTTNIERSIEALASSEGQTQLPIFEEVINCDKRFPRSFSESFNSPFVVLIGEDKYEWHIPIIYALKELFCEITDKHPRVTFREPELVEEGIEEIVDSLDPHSLEEFTLEYKIEFLDARKMRLAVDEFVKSVRGRLKSGFLQRFGVLVVAVKPKDLEKAKNALKFEGVRVYTCLPDNAKYETFCSKILGVSSLDKFFNNLRKYERYLDYTHRIFSIFVKRGADATDRHQYPLKVATFVYLVDELINRRNKRINNFKELCEFVNEILEKNIKVEATISEGRVVPDLIYSIDIEKEIFVEIETLLGTFEPLKKIDETIEKYKDIPNATIWIVFKPISAMIHYEELKARKKAYKVIYSDKEIDFKVLTLTLRGKFKWHLVSIDEFVRRKNVK